VIDKPDARLRARLAALADAVPVAPPLDRAMRATPAARTTGLLPMLTAAIVIVAAVVGASLLGRSPAPAATPLPTLASTAPMTAPATSTPESTEAPSSGSASGGTILRLAIVVEAPCPIADGQGCAYEAVLEGSGTEPQPVPTSGEPVPIREGSHTLLVAARVADGYFSEGSSAVNVISTCEAPITVDPGKPAIFAVAAFREGACVVAIEDGSAVIDPDANGPASDAVLPYPEGCREYRLSLRRCAYLVGEALDEAGVTPGEPARIELRGDPECEGKPAPCGVVRTIAFIVRVRVIPDVGRPFDHPVFCGVGGGGTLRCSNEPQVEVRSLIGFGYHDVPCPDSGCATPVPSINPDTEADAEALHVASLEIPIDHTGAYLVDVGEALLPNGILTEATATLADDRRTDVVIPDGIAIVIEGEDGQALTNIHDHGWREGTERVHVSLRFEVEMFDPGTSITLTDIVVR
jgi:hypothetical protein